MSDPSVQISNGTCYSSKGKVMDSSFIPCGNDFFGHKTCCGAGDNCLADNACFGSHGTGGPGTQLTYLAGCTDPDYRDASCPNKAPYEDQPWTGLVICGDPDDKGPHQWAACSQQGSPTTLRQGDPCNCDSTAATPAFTDSNSLANIASLPSQTGQSIGWAAGHVPSQPPPSATTTTTGSSTTSGGGTGGPTGPSSPSPPADGSDGGSSGLSTGAKAGIGVGAGLGGGLLLALVAFLLFFRQRRRQQGSPPPDMIEQQQQPGQPFDPHAAKLNDPRLSAGMTPSHLSTTPGTPGTTLSELEPRAARPWSLRSELEGNQPSPSLAEFADMHAAAAANGGGPAHGLAPAGVDPRGGARGGELSPVHELPG